MKRRDFLKFAGVIPAISFFRVNNALGLTAFTPDSSITFTQTDSMGSIFMGTPSKSLVVVAARPGQGKSSFLLNLLDTYGIAQGHSVAFFSLEQSKKSLVERWVSLGQRTGQVSKIPFHQKQMLTTEEIAKIEAISKSDVLIDDSVLSVEDIRRRVEKAINEKHQIKYVLVDYFQLVRTEGRYPSRLAQVQDILVQLKKLAVDLNLIVIASAQLNRGVDSRSNRRPVPNDLREIRDLSQIDELVLLYRDGHYDRTDKTDSIEIFKYTLPLLTAQKFKGNLARFTLASKAKISVFRKTVGEEYEFYRLDGGGRTGGISISKSDFDEFNSRFRIKFGPDPFYSELIAKDMVSAEEWVANVISDGGTILWKNPKPQPIG